MQATKHVTVDSNGWSKRSAYVPPHRRKALEEAARKEANKLDINSRTQFPTLGSATIEQIAVPTKTTFKEKIDSLIAFEQLSEQEKQARLQAKKASYVPPHLRKALEEAARKEANKLDINSRIQFPTLGSATIEQIAVPTKTTFKEKIDSLIAFEQLSEQEKQARLQAKKAMEGFEVLSLRLTPEYRRVLIDRQLARDRAVVQWELDVARGTQGLISLEDVGKQPLTVVTRVSKPPVYVYEDEEECDSVEEPEPCNEYI